MCFWVGAHGVAGRGIYTGTALQLVDDKSRVSIPAKFRDAIIANSDPETLKGGASVRINVHHKYQCLVGYDQARFEEEIARATATSLDRLDENGDPDDSQLRRLSGGGETIGFDSTGRCVLVGWHKRKANITKHAFFYGSIHYFEIWDPETLLADPHAPEVMKDACRGALEEKGLL